MRSTFAQFVGREFGLSFEGARYDALESSVLNATKASGLTPVALLNAVRAGDARVRSELIGALTIGETFFCREREHFEWLKRYLQRSKGCKRLWSAGCASGEEAYSMAITAIEALGDDARRVEIMATDLNPAALRSALIGEYRPWSFRCTGAAFRERWFERRGDLLRVNERVRSLVRFTELNLADPASRGPAGTDVIFCRNVLSYFDPHARKHASSVLRRALAAHGFVLTASTDPPLTDPALTRTRYDGIRCYVSAPAAAMPLVAPSACPASRKNTEPAVAAVRAFQAASPPIEASDASQHDHGSINAPIDTSQYVRSAQQALEQGDFDTVVRDARRALLVDSGTAYAHLLIAIAALRTRHLSLALRSARVGKKVIESPKGEAFFGLADGLTRQDLYELFTCIERFSNSMLLSDPWTAKQKKS